MGHFRKSYGIDFLYPTTKKGSRLLTPKPGTAKTVINHLGCWTIPLV